MPSALDQIRTMCHLFPHSEVSFPTGVPAVTSQQSLDTHTLFSWGLRLWGQLAGLDIHSSLFCHWALHLSSIVSSSLGSDSESSTLECIWSESAHGVTFGQQKVKLRLNVVFKHSIRHQKGFRILITSLSSTPLLGLMSPKQKNYPNEEPDSPCLFLNSKSMTHKLCPGLHITCGHSPNWGLNSLHWFFKSPHQESLPHTGWTMYM